MTKLLNQNIRAGSGRIGEPRPIGELFDELVSTSDHPFYVGYREWLASNSNEPYKVNVNGNKE